MAFLWTLIQRLARHEPVPRISEEELTKVCEDAWERQAQRRPEDKLRDLRNVAIRCGLSEEATDAEVSAFIHKRYSG